MEKKSDVANETSEIIRKRVADARQRQYERYGREICNGRVSYELLMKTSVPFRKSHATYATNG